MYEIVDVVDPKCQNYWSLYSVLYHNIVIMSLLHHSCTGVPCEVTDLIYNGSGQSFIECITGPEPQKQSYYPGMQAN